MTSLSMLRRKAKAGPAGQGSNLSAKLSFLDVIVDACQHSMRYTLIAESEGVTYTVMIDRGGPFNATGGGLTGSAALAMAASLRKGSYTVTEGWPVEQPLYQLGLDAALQNPSPGTRTETHKLPPARGVDAIRNAAWSTQPTNPAPASEDGDPFVNPARSWLVAEAPMPIETPTPYEAARLPDPSPATTNGRATVEFPHTPWMPGHAALQAAPASEPGVVDQSEVVAESEYAPEPAADAATAGPAEVARDVAIPEPTEATGEVMAEPAEIAQSEPAYDVDESARWLRVAASDTAMDVDAAAPAEPGISRRQGRIKTWDHPIPGVDSPGRRRNRSLHAGAGADAGGARSPLSFRCRRRPYRARGLQALAPNSLRLAPKWRGGGEAEEPASAQARNQAEVASGGSDHPLYRKASASRDLGRDPNLIDVVPQRLVQVFERDHLHVAANRARTGGVEVLT